MFEPWRLLLDLRSSAIHKIHVKRVAFEWHV